jgi:tape measure domain-containing protein
MATIGDLKIKVSAVTMGLRSGLRKAEKSLSKSARKMQNISRNMALKVSAPIIGIGGAALKASAELEVLETSFGTLTGSTEKAKDIMEDLKKFASKTPFQIAGLAQAQKTLMGFGLSIEESREQLELLGNASQGSSEKLKGLAVVMGQVKGAGKLDARDTLQFINQGVPIIQLLSDTLGKSAIEIKELTTKGKIGFEQVSAAMRMANEEGGMFYKGMERQSRTLQGVMSTLKDNVTLALVELGDDISETFDLKGVVTKLTQKIQAITKAFKNLSPEQKKVAIKMTAIAAAIPVVIGGLGALAAGLSAIAGLVAAISWPVTLAVAAIAALGVAFYNAYQSSESFRKGVNAVYSFLQSFVKDTIEQFKDFALFFKQFFSGDFSDSFDTAKGIIKRGFNKLGDAFEAGQDAFADEAPDPISISDLLGFDFDVFKKMIATESEALAEQTKTLDERIEALREKFSKATDEGERRSIASELLGLVSAKINNLKKAGKAASKELLNLREQLINLTQGIGTGTGDGETKEKEKTTPFIKDRERKLRIEEAAGRDTIALERLILNEKLKLYKKGTDEYKDALTDLMVFNEKYQKELAELEEQGIIDRNERNRKHYEAAIEQEKQSRISALSAVANFASSMEGTMAGIGRGLSYAINLINDLDLENISQRIADGIELTFADIGSMIAAVGAIASGVFESIGAKIGQNIQLVEQEKEARLKAIDQLRISEERKEIHRAKVAEKYDRKIAAMKTKQARADKAAAIAAAISNTAVAITATLGTPILAAVVAALGAAQVATIAAQPIPQFADGGIVSGRTLAEVGEYGSASRGNPEVIAPLDRLRSILGDTQGGNLTGEFRLRGDDLVVAVEQANRRSGRFSGRTQF